jgi:hypothetical protein
MATNWEFDDEEEEFDNGPANELPEPARKQMRRLEKQVKQQNELLAKYQAQERASSIAEVLKEKGMPAKVAALVPSSVDPTPEAVNAWLAEWSDVLGAKTEGEPPQGEPSPTTSVEPDVAQQIAQINSFSNESSSTNPVLPTTAAGIEAAIKATKTPEELTQLLQKLSGAIG